MKTLQVFGGVEAIVDDHLHPALSKMRWCLGNNGYPRTRIKCEEYPTGITRYLHQVVIGLDHFTCPCDTSYRVSGSEINHINYNKLDARLQNLEYMSKERNNQLHEKKASDSSQYRGATWFKRDSKWRAQIKVGDRNRHLGYFDSEEAAARAYDQYIVANHLDRQTNF